MIATATCDDNVIPNYPSKPFGKSRLARIHCDNGKAVYLCRHNTALSRSLYHTWALVRIVDGDELSAEETKEELAKFQNRRQTEAKALNLQWAKHLASHVGVAVLVVAVYHFTIGRSAPPTPNAPMQTGVVVRTSDSNNENVHQGDPAIALLAVARQDFNQLKSSNVELFKEQHAHEIAAQILTGSLKDDATRRQTID